MSDKPSRERMIDAAARLLQRQGYHGTGLNQVIADAKAPKGSLYFHFPGGKDQLVAEAITSAASYIDSVLARCERATARESFEAFLAKAGDHFEASGWLDGCPIATVALEVGPTHDDIRSACEAAFARLSGRVTQWLIKDGYPPEEAAEKAFLAYSAYEGALVFAKSLRSRAPIDRLHQHIGALL